MNDPADLYRQAVTLHQQGQLQQAEARYRQLLTLQPGHAQVLFLLATLEHQQGRTADALAHIRDALRLQPDRYEYHLQHGAILHADNQLPQAIAAFREALARKRGDETALNNLALALKQNGALTEAARIYEQILAANPRNPRIHFSLSSLKTYRRDDRNLQQMQALLGDPQFDVQEQAYLQFALSKASADLGEHEASFSHLRQGNDLIRSTFAYDLDQIRGFFAALKQTFSRDFLASAPTGSHDTTPLFIVGMPRSGSTLIEQILASHPLVEGAGEHLYFQDAAFSATALLNQNNYPAAATALSAPQLQQIADRYLATLRHHGPQARHICDKMLRNIFHVGLIKMVFPDARVIHCLRHPLDTCFSCYRHFFGGFVPYCYNLEELGNYYLLYRDLMRHWHQVLDGFILDIHYEDIVHDAAGQTRRILEFCGLPWDDACSNFQQTARAVQTASLAQVRQPLYRSAIGSWRPYRKQLQPLVALLAEETARYHPQHGNDDAAAD